MACATNAVVNAATGASSLDDVETPSSPTVASRDGDTVKTPILKLWTRVLGLALIVLAFTAASASAAGMSPRATFTVTPTNPVAGQQVTFNATASQCFDTAWTASCSTYRWEDDGDATDPLDSPTLLGTGRTISFTFNYAATKYVWLTVTDAAGRQTQTRNPVVVSPASTSTPRRRRTGTAR